MLRRHRHQDIWLNLFEGLALKLLCDGAGEDGARMLACPPPRTSRASSSFKVVTHRSW
ncbi:hypothetical protein K466DRAFT_582296 [Polyporus arcularius HHB13444]|uniref:Uncharacterized protein n=1 Tax=Polyporus arcularius HHB13444 TaxID=1314778 RepID=A0A5C3PSC3_9APHY|nr:hypothetical protein K466DRAFT_582296 [Polyporus arcularius HHB13444]